jgi:hypothetical protein
MGTDALVIAIFVLAPPASLALNANSAPPQNYFAATTQVERLYKENGRVVANPIMDAAAADAACPNGNQVARQTSRVDGSREYLVWTLRCR